MNNSTVQPINRVNKCYYEFITWYHVILLILGIFIISCNLFVLVFIQLSRLLRRNAGNFILVGLSLIDMFTGIHIVIHILPSFYFLSKPCDNFLFQRLDNAGYLVGKICILGSIGHLLLLAGERMIGLFLPLHFKSMIVQKRVFPAIVGVWIVSICLPLIELTYRKSSQVVYYRRIQVLVTITCFGILPTLLLCAQYIAMLRLIYNFQRKRSIDIKSMFSKHKALFIYLAMFLSFLILTLPHFVIRSILAFTEKFPDISLNVLHVITIMRYLPSLFDPFIYAVFKEDFRKVFTKIRRSRSLESEGWTLSRLSSRRFFQQASQKFLNHHIDNSQTNTTELSKNHDGMHTP